tara:strand:- start:228 stop:809 length:582 start_codon:yes stop_codon:yes gene_type:complete
MNQKIIQRIANQEDLVVPTLFKPIQFNIIKKLSEGKKLNENEKRYLRGNIKKKLQAIENLYIKGQNEYISFLNNLNSYHITGLEALKHNGYGWYFKTKIIEIINTKIQGKLILSNKTLKLIRVKSITNSKVTIDKKTGLKYATNEQIIKDTKITKNNYTKKVWENMLLRYKKLFVKNHSIQKEKSIDYLKYGV